MARASENLVHWTSVVRFLPLGRVGDGRSSRKIRKAKFTAWGTEILNICWQAFWLVNWPGPVKTWYTGPQLSGFYPWGGWGRVYVAARSEKQK